MELVIQKWGNSNGVRLPKKLLDTLNLKTNDKLDVHVKDNEIIMSKINKYLSFDERLKNYHGEKLVNEFDWGEAVGKEIW